MATVDDIRVHVTWRGHFKRGKLRKRVGADGVLALIDLWIWTAANRSGGVLDGMGVEDIEEVANWEGERGALVAALVDVRFLDRAADGVYSLHNWAKRQPWAIGAAKRSEDARAAALARWEQADRMRPPSGPDTNGKPNACPPHAESMPHASAPHAGGNAPFPSSPSLSDPSEDPESDAIASGDGKPSRKRGRKSKTPDAPPLPFRAAHAVALVASAAGPAFVPVAPLPAGYAIGIEAHVKAYPDDSDWTALGEYLASGRVHFDEAPGPSVLAGNYGAELLAKARAWTKAGKPAKGANGSHGAAAHPPAVSIRLPKGVA